VLGTRLKDRLLILPCTPRPRPSKKPRKAARTRTDARSTSTRNPRSWQPSRRPSHRIRPPERCQPSTLNDQGAMGRSDASHSRECAVPDLTVPTRLFQLTLFRPSMLSWGLPTQGRPRYSMPLPRGSRSRSTVIESRHSLGRRTWHAPSFPINRCHDAPSVKWRQWLLGVPPVDLG
jgi:hypothetical protein